MDGCTSYYDFDADENRGITKRVYKYVEKDKVFDDVSMLVEEYRDWYNNERYNLGITDYPV